MHDGCDKIDFKFYNKTNLKLLDDYKMDAWKLFFNFKKKLKILNVKRMNVLKYI